MKKVTMIIAAVALASAMSASAAITTNKTAYTEPASQSTPVIVVPIDFKGTIQSVSGTKTKVSTADWGPTGTVQWARIQTVTGIVTNEEVSTSDDSTTPPTVTIIGTNFNVGSIVTGTNLTSIIGTTKIQTNQVPLGGGTNLIQVIAISQVAVEEDASVLDSKGNYTASYSGEVGSNLTARQLLFTGNVKEDKKNPGVPKINLKVNGVWLDKLATIKNGTIKNAK